MVMSKHPKWGINMNQLCLILPQLIFYLKTAIELIFNKDACSAAFFKKDKLHKQKLSLELPSCDHWPDQTEPLTC